MVDLVGVADRDALLHAAADIAGLLAFQFPAQLQFELFEAGKKLRPHLFEQRGVAWELVRVQALHFADHGIDFALGLGRLAGETAEFAQALHAFPPDAVSSAGHRLEGPVAAVHGRKAAFVSGLAALASLALLPLLPVVPLLPLSWTMPRLLWSATPRRLRRLTPRV